MLPPPSIYSQTLARTGPRHPRAVKSWVSTQNDDTPIAAPIAVQDMPKVGAPQLPSAGDQRPNQVAEQMLAILTSPPAPGETAVIAFRRKEAELLAVCATLSPVESMQLARRLESAKAGDELAAAFGRLIVERRQRVIQFLNDARRRAAIAGRK